MWKLLILTIAMSGFNAEASRRTGKRYASYGGTGAGSYAGGDDYDDYGYAPNFGAGFIDPYVFHQQLTAQILAQHAAQHNAIASTYSVGDSAAYADASLYPDDIAIQQQAAAGHQGGYYSGGAGSSGGHRHRYAPNYAAASGSIGPGGYHQTAYISPANPAVPNISNRFGGSSSPGGYKGVSVSSFSSSSDIDGKRSSQRGAQTTVNDNGKVTTYRVHS